MIKFILYLTLVGGGSIEGRSFSTEHECKATGRAMVARHYNVKHYMCTQVEVLDSAPKSTDNEEK